MTDYGRLIVGQLEFYWDVHLWPRLKDGLTDDEYFWEPVAGCWSVRPDPSGKFVLDGEARAPGPAPFTTLAWRMIHVATTMSTRTSTFFGAGPAEADMFDPRHLPAELPATAGDALQLLDASYRGWHDAIAALDASAWERKLGPRAAFYADEPMAALIVHINREVMHHGGEICLLRDLYAAREG